MSSYAPVESVAGRAGAGWRLPGTSSALGRADLVGGQAATWTQLVPSPPVTTLQAPNTKQNQVPKSCVSISATYFVGCKSLVQWEVGGGFGPWRRKLETSGVKSVRNIQRSGQMGEWAEIYHQLVVASVHTWISYLVLYGYVWPTLKVLSRGIYGKMGQCAEIRHQLVVASAICLKS